MTHLSLPHSFAPEKAILAEEPELLILRPTRGIAALRLREIWQFRDLLFTLAGRDLKLRYKQTALGAAWVLLQPLAAAGIFNFVFGIVAGLHTSFLLTFAGTAAWTLFANTLSKISTCLVGNSHLISKVFFPRLILPFSAIPSALVDFAIALAMLVILMIAGHIVPGLPLLSLPLWIGLLLMLATGVGLLAASLMVSYRDIAYIVPVALQLLMFASPVAYATAQVPAKWRFLFEINPISPLLDGFRWSITSEAAPNLPAALIAALVSALSLAVGVIAFKRMERRFADVI